MSVKQKTYQHGFTLVELIVVLGIVGFLASAAIAAVNPAKRIAEARNATRWAEVNAILNAILYHQLDNRATFMGTDQHPIVDGATAQIIVATDTGLADCTVAAPHCAGFPLNTSGVNTCFANLSGLVPKYIGEIAPDPVTGSATDTQYYISRNSSRIEIGACNPEAVNDVIPSIRVTR